MADEFCRHGVQAGNYCSKCGKEVVSAEMAMAAREADPTEGLPADLARVLRDPSIIVPRDQAVFEKVAEWMNAPTTTLSAMTADEWQDAWSVVQRRLDQRERDLDAAGAVLRKWSAEKLALKTALMEIAAKARWYAENDTRDPHEVDHALCVEVLALAEEALDA